MLSLLRILAVSALVTAATASVIAPVSAAPISQPLAITRGLPNITSNPTQPVFWRGGWGWGAPVAGGLIAGAIVGGALAAPYYYGPGYYPGPAYYGAPAYAPPPGDDDSESYCMQRFKSYDPNTGTYLGKDGRRHSCP
jgi:hypothetical protein